jgi:hypothetical protein
MVRKLLKEIFFLDNPPGLLVFLEYILQEGVTHDSSIAAFF